MLNFSKNASQNTMRQAAFFLLFLFVVSLPSMAAAETAEASALLDRIAKAFVAVSKKAGPAVVHVRVEKSLKEQSGKGGDPFGFFNDPFFERFFGPQFRSPRGQQPREHKQQGSGSGFIVSKDGHILTNNHVVADVDKIRVILSDKREFIAKVIGTDPQSDIAMIKIEDGDDLPVLPLGDSDAIEVGESVIAIGNPFELSQTVTVGVISAKGRSRVGINDYENFIQTDAAINPGNSGGPLINIHGEAIGINTAIFSRSGGYMGIGFAIPVNMAKQIKAQLMEHGKVTRGWLGVVIQDVNKDLANSFGLDKARGVLVGEVTPDSPAEKGGLKHGDVIIMLDNVVVQDVAALRNRVAMLSPGSKVKVTVLRDSKEKVLRVRIGEQPALFAKQGRTDNVLDNMGLSLQDLDKELARQFDYPEDSGVLIVDVKPDSSAWSAGLRSGHLIEEANKQAVHSLKELRRAVRDSDNHESVLLRVRVGEHRRYVVLRRQ